MRNLLLKARDQGVCQDDAARGLGMVVLLVAAILATARGIAGAAWLGRQVEYLADLGAGFLEGVWELVGHFSDEDVDGE